MFKDSEEFVMFSPLMVSQLKSLTVLHGDIARDGPKEFRTLMAHWDDTDHTRKRAADFPISCSPSLLINGNLCAIGLWSDKAISSILNGDYPLASVITEEEFKNLLPVEEGEIK